MKFTSVAASWPLTIEEIQKVHQAALKILEKTGMANPPDFLIEPAVRRGCSVNADGRLLFPAALVEDIISEAQPRKIYPAREEEKNIHLDDGLSHNGIQGVAPMVVDFKTGKYRPSTLLDLYDFNRLIDILPNIHWGGGGLIAGDVTDPTDLVLNEIYAVMAATTKHSLLGFDSPDQLELGFALLEMIIGDDQHKRERSPVTFGFCPTKSPLSYGRDFLTLSVKVAQRGYPVCCIVAPMSGITAPVTLAGALAMTVAEALGAFVAVQIAVPRHPVLLGIWPFVGDLRTAAFSGGAPESALLMGGAARIIDWYGIEGCVAAGITDSKTIDAQFGYEKGITTSLAAVAGASTMGETAGMVGSLMGGSLEALVIDNEMLGGINRIRQGIEINDETLSYGVIRDVVEGDNNFMLHSQTVQKMKTEYLYPRISDRELYNKWEEKNCPEIRDHARAETVKLLSSHYPSHIHPDLDRRIRQKFNILLPREAMGPDSGRW